MTDEAEEPKLIIDEDYKSQVEREKREAQAKQAQEPASPSEAATEAPAADASEVASQAASAAEANQASSPDANQELPPPPPASMQMLVTSLATQAVAAMGQLPDPEGQNLPPNADYARHFIDLIGMLEEKTKGNLSDEENNYLQETLHQLRMLFVEFCKRP